LSFSWSAAIERDFAYTPDGNGQFDPHVSLPSLTHPNEIDLQCDTSSYQNAEGRLLLFFEDNGKRAAWDPGTPGAEEQKQRRTGGGATRTPQVKGKPTLKLKNPQHHPRNGN
jgi:hypothetical protein